MEADYDLIIAGAGPAGTACAITAARSGARVLLLDKDSFPRQKVCGEFVSAESLKLLRSLLMNDPFEKVPQITSARVFLDGRKIELAVSPAARSIPRFDLDASLIQAARAAGVEVSEEATVREISSPGIFEVRTHAKTFCGKAVVNATGRWSELTRFAAADNQRWIGLKAHFDEVRPPLSVDLYFFDGGYCGVQPVSDISVNVCAMVRATAATRLQDVFRLHPGLEARSNNWKQRFPAVTTSALYFRIPKTEERGAFLAGDSAAFIDPFAGDGISLALHSGTAAAECALKFVKGQCSLPMAQEQYKDWYRSQLAPVLRNAALLRRLLAAPHWVRSVLMVIAGNRRVREMMVRSTRIRRIPEP